MVKRRENEVHSDLELLEALKRQALEEVGGEVPKSAPDPKKAILAVTGGFVQPAVKVPHSDPAARDRVDALWHKEADRLAILDRSREFLLLATYPGSLARGWIRVRDLIGGRLPSRVAAASGSRDFIAVSLDGKSLCAVSVEEYEDWIVTHSFEDGGTAGR
ncbi:hypothetical protein OG462_21830 [Streptomyces sp. NBC_01077]|uniref:hypothetical protein n=1 Tax=Streptomyces sp. NBC_01077 TaxID=2903746 RepID=UPI003865838A|nr:hypothetical protein OG462_21830 [Streptomyces sp. NBC_01077]